MKPMLLGAISLALLMFAENTHAFQPTAKAVFVFHPKTHTTVLNHNGDTSIPPASLAKLMTLYTLFNALKDGRLSMESELPISHKAWKKGGSKMFLEVNKTVKVEDLIHGVIVSSGNDACIVIAEHLAGSEAAFADQMNTYARALGMHNTTFKNASGWPEPGQVTTAKDMALLAQALIKEFPEYYPFFSEQHFTYNEIRQTNRNRLLARDVGVDGLKTGHTEEAGYHLVSSGTSQDARLISVVLGADSFNMRESEALAGLRYGFNTHSERRLLNQYQTMVEDAAVWMGDKRTIKLVSATALDTYLPKQKKDPISITLTYASPLLAPLEAGQEIGTINVHLPNETRTVPLLVGEGTQKITGLTRLWRGALYRLGL